MQVVLCIFLANSYLADIWQAPHFAAVVRDRLMIRTFAVISIHFPAFTVEMWFVWFHQRLVPLLPSFTKMMLSNATSYLNCTSYRIV